jgi:hypothetical protein
VLNTWIKKVTILLQVNLNSWNFIYVHWKALYYSNFKDNHTWDHYSLMKLDFIDSINLKHVTFDNSYELHQISYAPTINNLWLPLVTFFRWSLVVWRPIDLCMTCWTIFHALGFILYISWITLGNDILVKLSKKYPTSQSSSHMTITSLPTKYALNLRVV